MKMHHPLLRDYHATAALCFLALLIFTFHLPVAAWGEERPLADGSRYSGRASTRTGKAIEYVPGEMIVKFKGVVGENVEEALGKGKGFARAARLPAAASLDELNRRFGVKEPKALCPMMRLKGRKLRRASAHLRKRLERVRERKPGLAHIFKLKVSDRKRDIREICREYARDPNVEYAEPNYIVQRCATPNDPEYPDLWGMHNTGQDGGTADADIDAPEAWELQTGSQDVVVAVIDTGVDYNHEDLAANMWTNPGETPGNGIDDDGNGYVDDVYGYDFSNDDGDPWDDHYHGTHCSGTIGGVGNNGVGVTGVCWNVKIMAVKFLNSGGSGSTDGAISSVNYATLMGADLSSNSWGGGGFSQALKDAIDAAGDAGALFIAAAGNNGTNNDTNPFYPAAYSSENLIAVAATDRNDGMAYFSCWGPTSVDIGAPGVSILSSRPNNTYGLLDGTSMATPHVSGLAALIRSHDPALTHMEIKQVLMDTVDPIPALSGKVVTEGRINANSAIASLVSSQGRVTLDRDEYNLGDTVTITVRDTDLDINPGAPDSTTVGITSAPTGDSETVTLTETGASTKAFRGTILVVDGTPSQGEIQAVHGDTITATYNDDDDGTGQPQVVTATAAVDAEGPVISGVGSNPSSTSCTVTWTTDEGSNSSVNYGLTPGLGLSASSGSMVTSHSIKISSLEPETLYYFDVVSTDQAGNETTDNNAGNHYNFTTLDAAPILFVDDDVGASYETYYIQALDAGGFVYDTWNVSAVGSSPTGGDLSAFDKVIWTTGYNYSASGAGLTSTEEAAIKSYLDGGGRLFLSGQDVLYNGVSSVFKNSYLHLASYDSDDQTTSATGVSGDPISEGMVLNLSYPFYNWSDSLNPDSNAAGVFLTDGSTTYDYCAVRYPASGSATFRVVFFAFPFEAVSFTAADPNNSKVLMARILSWLGGDSPPPTSTPVSPTAVPTSAPTSTPTATSQPPGPPAPPSSTPTITLTPTVTATPTITPTGLVKLSLLKSEGIGDFNLYVYNSLAVGEWTYWDALDRNPSPVAMDRWVLPVGNDAISVAAVKGDDLYILKREYANDINLYLYNNLVEGDWTYWDAVARNPSPLARDLWVVPSGNDAISMASVDITGDEKEELAVLKREGLNDMNIYYYNSLVPGDWSYWDAIARNPSPIARDMWVIPSGNNAVDLAAIDVDGGLKELVIIKEKLENDHDLYFYRNLVPGDWTYWDAVSRNPSPLMRDMWVITSGNDSIGIATLDMEGDGQEEISILKKDELGDVNIYYYRSLEVGDWSYWDAVSRNPSPIARDLWFIPAGNDAVGVTAIGNE